jgi:hypothetical protein
MMRKTKALTAALIAALSLAACGKDEGSPIPAQRAAKLEKLLQQVQAQVDAGSCRTLRDATIPRLESEAARLPRSVGSDVRATIDDGIAHLRQLVDDDCNSRQQPTTTESTTTSESTTTPSTTSETTTPPTTTDTTTETTTPPTTTDTTTETTPPPTTTPPTTTTPGAAVGGTPSSPRIAPEGRP